MTLIKENGSSLFFPENSKTIFEKIMQFSEQVLAVYMKKEYTMSVLEIKIFMFLLKIKKS